MAISVQGSARAEAITGHDSQTPARAVLHPLSDNLPFDNLPFDNSLLEGQLLDAQLLDKKQPGPLAGFPATTRLQPRVGPAAARCRRHVDPGLQRSLAAQGRFLRRTRTWNALAYRRTSRGPSA